MLAQTILPYILGESSFEEIMEKPRWTIEYFGSNTSSKIKFEFLDAPEISRLGEKGHEISIENKFIGEYLSLIHI